jgi:FkbM family methyltransferase
VGYPDPELRYLSRLCDARKVSIDIGASQGVYVIHMLAHSASVEAFEPRLAAVAELKRIFSSADVVVHPVALSDRDGNRTMVVCTTDLGRSTLEKDNPIDGVREDVQIRTLDSFHFAKVGFIKIDVEGHEMALLNGAKATIERERPNLLIEIEERHKPGSTKAVPEFFSSLGYSGWYLLDGAWKPQTTFRPELHQRLGVTPYINNFVFIPGEKGNLLVRN